MNRCLIEKTTTSSLPGKRQTAAGSSLFEFVCFVFNVATENSRGTISRPESVNKTKIFLMAVLLMTSSFLVVYEFNFQVIF